MAAFPNLNSDAGLKKLDKHLLTRSFITGYNATKDDIIVYAALVNPQTSIYVNLSRWYNHIKTLLIFSGISPEGSGLTIDGLVASITKEALFPASIDGVVDPIAEETVEEKKADEEERVGSSKASSRKIIKSSKSWVMIITPQNDETDMKKLEEAVRSFRMAGLFWGGSNLAPIGYGIKLLRIKFTIVDDLSHCYGILWKMIIPSAQTYDFIPLKNSLIVMESNADEADVKKLEEAVRSIKMEGVLFWGASKLLKTSCGTKVLGMECSTVEHFVCLDTTVKEQIIANGYVERCHIFDTKGVSAWCGIDKEPLATRLADDSEDVTASLKATTEKSRSEKSWLMLVSKVGKNEVNKFIRLTEKEGLIWGASKVVKVGYGIECLRIIFTIVDDLVCPHTIIEGAQKCLESIVVIALNKICKYPKPISTP
ncbi:unnamed protein product [Microthlaspi erraticum]|uniref:Translation elongation factor EF1B beta/delta subunit guanine nucleotide exchange domain-containing protein n=1 Tax=Microthlaspi erraticum TaxID=1685480 RepID=A0A6D2KUA2_9BRAS|nr:unnamed protein product [Microthlaspi erraticum]